MRRRLEAMSDTPHTTSAQPAEPAPGMRAPLSAIDVLAFVCEMIAIVSLSLWGFTMFPFAWNILTGLGAPAAAILVWALFVSPRAVFAVHPFVRAIVELLVYASATVAWWMMGNAWIGLGFGIVAVTVGVIAGRRRIA